MKNRGIFCLTAVLACCFLLSCINSKEVYWQYQPINLSGWDKETEVDFRIDTLLVSPQKKYDIFVEVVNNGQYRYKNLWLSIRQNLTDTAFVNERFEITVADSVGKWKGSGSAGLYQLSVPYKASLSLDTARSYTIAVSQSMSDPSLKGIDKLGIRIAESNR